MSNEADKYWNDVVRELRRKRGRCSLTPEQDKEMVDKIPDEQLGEEEITDIVETITSGELTNWTPQPDVEQVSDIDTSNITKDVLQLNRNLGESDPETDELLKE